MNLNGLTKAELIQEIERLRPKQRKALGAITAGMDILKDDLLVVDEEKRIAYVHPEVKIIPDKIRIHGYAVRNFKKGQTVRIHHWFDYEPR